jgi:prepilin peptidase CpaA
MNAFLYPVWSGLKSGLIGFAMGFGIYFALYAVHAMGAGDVKLMGAVGALVGWQNWLGIFAITAVVGGLMALIVILARKRFMKTIFNVGFIFSEMKSGRAAYMSREDLDVKSPKSMGLPHGAIIAVGVFFFLAFSARFSR